MIKYAVLLAVSLAAAPTAFADNHFEKVRGITDGSPYPLTLEQSAAGRRGDKVASADSDWFEKQRRISDGSHAG
jgi:hypothetical protein